MQTFAIRSRTWTTLVIAALAAAGCPAPREAPQHHEPRDGGPPLRPADAGEPPPQPRPGGEPNEDPPPQQEPRPVRPAFPPALLGTWFAGAGGISHPYDPDNGGFGRPNGDALSYRFLANGSYEKAFHSYVSNGGCSSGASAFETGMGAVQDDRLVLVPETGVVRYRYSCSPSLDSDEPVEELAEERFQFRFESGELVLTTDTASGRFRHIAQ